MRKTSPHCAGVLADIDTPDMPEVTDWSGVVRRGLYPPVKRLTSLRLDTDLLEWFKRGGEGYQTRIDATCASASRAASADVRYRHAPRPAV
jgi:uncharacterized protein (DUF4415 family)